MEKFAKIEIVGLGYIGLPTAAVLAQHVPEVVGLDINAKVVETINQGKIHIVEPDLQNIVADAVSGGRLRATVTAEAADVFIISVPTPFKGSSHTPDTSYIESAAKAIAPVLARGNLVILESTSPVGTTEELSRWLSHMRHDLTFPHNHGENADVQVAHCPERVIPGQIMKELVHNDRVIGGISKKCTERAVALYKIFVKGDCILTKARTAELVKLAENTFRDINIAFANELAVICDKLGIDVWEVISLANHHPRVNIHQPGPGVGGHCIPVVPWFIVHSAPAEARLIRTAREINDERPDYVVAQIRQKARQLKKPVIACLGLSYKPDTNDLRESPSVRVVEMLARERLGDILLVEPYITALPNVLQGLPLRLCDLDSAMRDANIVVLLVNHRLFAQIDRTLLRQKEVVDTRGVWR